MTGSDPLRLFHPVVRTWFSERLGEPTEAQVLAWPAIAAGEHVLVAAPTGSGKTLAAFLFALDHLLTGAWPGEATRVLYVSPLRALGADVRRNLLRPLAELGERFEAAGIATPAVRVLTRSGDTPTEERRRMTRRPPEILITTPESLNILLTSEGGRGGLVGVRCVILDEVHAVLESKRGVHLITAVERLVRLAGEVQRVALSATVRPLDEVARWVGGAAPAGDDPLAPPLPRPVRVLASGERKRYDLKVSFPAAGVEDADEASPEYWEALVGEVLDRVRANRSTLVFGNSRRLVEKLTRFLNDAAGGELVYSHHGSLAREIRQVVEERLKAGALRGIVATSSLELGIDVGALDEVVLVQTPHSLASAAQRIGRAGHTVGGVARARFMPLFARDLLDAAVVAGAVAAGEIEPLRPIAGALDVLAQVVVSATASETWSVNELFALLRRAYPYRNLPRRQFDLVLEMLAGRYSTGRIRELDPVVSVDRVAGTVRGRPGAARRVYASAGTIPDRGYFRLRLADTRALLGELDEEFVWERAVGDSFCFGVRTYRIVQVTDSDVLVRPASGPAGLAPFWRADERDRPFERAEKVARFLEQVEPRLGDPDLPERLAADGRLTPGAARALQRWLVGQRDATGKLPHLHRVVVEHVADPQQPGPAGQVVIHTFWGGKVNRPFALALQAAWSERHGGELSVIHDDDCLIVAPPNDVDAGELLRLVRPESLEELLRSRLEATGFWGARFRAAAGTALLLPRAGFGRRTPLWLTRQRAKELLAAVRGFADFPIVLEAWRSCLEDDCDLEALRRLLVELGSGAIEVHEVRTDHPSPFASQVLWRRTNQLMYEDDASAAEGGSCTRRDLLAELLQSSHLRPRLAPGLVETFRRKLQRVFPGYAPRTAAELCDLVEERVLLTPAAWHELGEAVAHDTGRAVAELVAELGERVVGVRAPGVSEGAVCALQAVPRVLRALGLEPVNGELLEPDLAMPAPPPTLAALARLWDEEPDAGETLEGLVGDLLRSHGPVPLAALPAVLGLDDPRLEEAVATLRDGGQVIVDELVAGAAGAEVCDAGNLERLLRLQRAAARPHLEPLPLAALAAFLADWQGLGTLAPGVEGLKEGLERLWGYPALAHVWEEEILPARLEGYQPAWLDALFAETELAWAGCGHERLAFLLPADRELVLEAGDDPELEAALAEVRALFPGGAGRFTLAELAAHTGLASAELTRRLWRLAWLGLVTNDGFAAVRRGIESGFEPATGEPAHGHGARRRLRFAQWQGTRPFVGSWLPTLPAPAEDDPLAAEELVRDRARLLLQRYGVVFRELVARELPALQWGRIVRALRLMELGGEAVGGPFFDGIGGLQLASPAAVRRLERGVVTDRVVAIPALDPASPCGLGLAGLPKLPRRAAGNWTVWHGPRLVAAIERRGAALTIHVGPDHPALPAYLGVLKLLLGRGMRPLRAITVETINGEPAATSPYRPALAALAQAVTHGGGLRLLRRW
ncbi:MAG TPA: DEAD/DEAH box helicase [Thermoanaerobaculaceae bacterium]|nr:DEAD/DEAH box helicase [Thermoanaerobaculaceae bacterium]HRS15268.1 DEAD/DEAH box helicase [Thermoanaerobaculaceae bacterium]